MNGGYSGGYSGGGCSTSPAVVLIFLMLIGGLILYLTSYDPQVSEPPALPAASPSAMQAAPTEAVPTATPAMPDPALIEEMVNERVKVELEKLHVAQDLNKAAQAAANAALDKANAEQAEAAALQAQAESLTRIAEANTALVAAKEKDAKLKDQEAARLQNTLIAYAILILGAASACGVFIIAVGLTIRSLLKARQRREEAAYRLLMAERKLSKNTTPMRGPEKRYTDAPVVGHPHPREDGVKEFDRTTKGRPVPDQHVQQKEKRQKAYPPGIDD